MKQIFPWLVTAIVLVICTLGCKTMGKDTSSLPLTIAEKYKVTNTSKESISGPIPDQKPTTQVFVELTGNEKKAYLFYWDGTPYRDLGPMSELESWKTEFMDGEASVTRTKMFMGQEQEVLVLHHKLTQTERVMVYSSDMNRDEFHELLRNIQQKNN